jgi:1-deoxy-D-xylulose-5-phosphate synthase
MIVWRKRKAGIKTEATIPSTRAILFLPAKENTLAARGAGAKIKQEPRLLEIGKAEVVQHGRDVAIFGLGAMFEIAEGAAR